MIAQRGFVDGHLDQVVNDDPSNHSIEGACRHCGKNGDLLCPHCKSTDVQIDAATKTPIAYERFRLLILMAQQQKNSKFFLGCLLFAIGDPAAEGVSFQEYGKQWAVSRQAVSKKVNFIRLFLGLPPSPYMKSEESRTAFRQSNRRPSKHVTI